MRKFSAFISVLFLSVMILGLLPVHSEEAIYDKVLRLHVIANSDSDQDQELKLKVRNAILKETDFLLKDCKSFDKAMEIISDKSSLEKLKTAAEKVIEKENFNYDVKVSLGKESYPKKTYANMCFPNGIYNSLKVQIGAHEGHNWWCVLFPSLCMSVASESNKDAFINAGFTPDQYKIVTESKDKRYEVRFKILDVIRSAKG